MGPSWAFQECSKSSREISGHFWALWRISRGHQGLSGVLQKSFKASQDVVGGIRSFPRVSGGFRSFRESFRDPCIELAVVKIHLKIKWKKNALGRISNGFLRVFNGFQRVSNGLQQNWKEVYGDFWKVFEHVSEGFLRSFKAFREVSEPRLSGGVSLGGSHMRFKAYQDFNDASGGSRKF